MKSCTKGTGLVLAVLIYLVFASSAVANAARSEEITVSAAMSLKNAFEEIGKRYASAHKGVRVMFNFGASGDLMRQVEGGAPVDVIATASKKEMDELERNRLVVPGSRVEFASNSVVMIVPLKSKNRIKSFEALRSARINRVAIANPQMSPAGRYAGEVLRYYSLMPSIRDKLVFAGNVRQVLDYVARGEVDAGIVYATDAATRTKEVSIAATATKSAHGPILYPAAAVSGTKSSARATEFIALLASSEGKEILRKYGFGTTAGVRSRK